MTLAVIATFSGLTEAQIAAGALRAGGLHAEVADQHFGSVVWTDQVALQGFRLTVPKGEAAAARALLAEILAEPPPEPAWYPPRKAGNAGWRFLAVALALTLNPLFGWLAVGGLRSRGGQAMLGVGVAAAAFLAVTAVIIAATSSHALGRVIGLLIVVVIVAAVGRLARSAAEHRKPGAGEPVSTAPDEE